MEAGQDDAIWKVISQHLVDAEIQRSSEGVPEDPAFPPGPRIIIREILGDVDDSSSG